MDKLTVLQYADRKKTAEDKVRRRGVYGMLFVCLAFWCAVIWMLI